MRRITLRSICLLAMVFYAGCDGVPTSPIQMGEAGWFPDGKRFVFQANEGDNTGLYIYDISTHSVHIFPIKVPGDPFSPCISPDGSRMAFAVRIPSEQIRSDIYLSNADGSNPLSLVSTQDAHWGPIFSSDGRFLVFVKSRVFKNYSPIARPHFHQLDLFALDLTTNTVWPLTDKKYFTLSNPAVDPRDGSIVVHYYHGSDRLVRMAWTGLEDPLAAIQVLRPNLSAYLGVPQVKNPESFDWSGLYYPAFDQKGGLYFVWPGHYQGYFGHEVYRWTSQSDQTSRLTDLRSELRAPRPSPDGQYVAFLKKMNESVRLHILSVDNGAIIRVPFPSEQKR